MKAKQLMRRLQLAGVEIDTRGNGGHVLLRYRGEQAILPVHGDTDIAPVFIRRLCKQLGLEPEKVL
jgi:mRNA interferase HicA